MVGLLNACAPDASAPTPPNVAAEIGDPIPGLTPADMARFETGRLAFNRQFTPENGLGPRYNENSCNACHTTPADGGTGEDIITKATRSGATTACDVMGLQGGENLRLRVTPAAAAAGATRPKVPDAATHSARFTIPFLFGMGLIDQVPQATLDSLADPDDANGDGISGRVGRDAAGRPARFGRKADQARLADFADSAFRLEMGVTTPAHPDERMAGDTPPTGSRDPAPDPEVDAQTFASAVDFARFLAPPSSGQPADSAGRALAEQGKVLFSSIGCVSCHRRTMRTGASEDPALSEKTFALYSDLLLHDMGPGLEGTCAAGATSREWRTEPLMGLRYRRDFLHDGRAGAVIDAVLAHGGEAEGPRNAFVALGRVTQEAVLRFLGTL